MYGAAPLQPENASPCSLMDQVLVDEGTNEPVHDEDLVGYWQLQEGGGRCSQGKGVGLKVQDWP